MGIAMTGAEKAAVLLVLLGEDTSAGILRHFDEPEILAVGRAISSLGGIDPQVARTVLEEYQGRILAHQEAAAGGPDVARRVLARSLSPERARAMESASAEAAGDDPAAGGTGPAGDPFASLASVSERDLGQALELEHPQTAALVLLHLPPARAAAALDAMSEEAQAGIAGRLSKLSRISTDVTREVSDALRVRFESIRSQGIEERDGTGATAEILKCMDRARSRSILARVELTDPETAQILRARIYTFEMLGSLEDRGVQELLKGVDSKQLALALKGTTPEIVEKFLRNMSTRAAELVRDEIEFLGVARVKDVEAAQREVLDRALRLEEEGSIAFTAAAGSGDAG